MKEKIRGLLLADKARFLTKGLFGNPEGSFSMRIPGQSEFLLVRLDREQPEAVAMHGPGDGVSALHARLYRSRKDAGALLISSTPWSAALASIDMTIPVLFLSLIHI